MSAEDRMGMWTQSATEEEYIGDWQDWYPEPLEAYKLPLYCSKHSDTLTLLVGIYESPSSFVSEYQYVLGCRILSRLIDLERFANQEKNQLQILSEKFGESETVNCRTMLSDVARSSAYNKKEFRWPVRIGTNDITNVVFPDISLKDSR